MNKLTVLNNVCLMLLKSAVKLRSLLLPKSKLKAVRRRARTMIMQPQFLMSQERAVLPS